MTDQGTQPQAAHPAPRAVASTEQLRALILPLVYQLLAEADFELALRKALGDEPLLGTLQECARQTGVPVNMLGGSVLRMAAQSLRSVACLLQKEGHENHARNQ